MSYEFGAQGPPPPEYKHALPGSVPGPQALQLTQDMIDVGEAAYKKHVADWPKDIRGAIADAYVAMWYYAFELYRVRPK